jgi:DNA gyrase inhibitor GyrI
MSEGFVLDLAHANAKVQQKWVKGEPVKSFWFGIKTSDRESFHVRTYRCDRCGYLESYAKDSVD